MRMMPEGAEVIDSSAPLRSNRARGPRGPAFPHVSLSHGPRLPPCRIFQWVVGWVALGPAQPLPNRRPAMRSSAPWGSRRPSSISLSGSCFHSHTVRCSPSSTSRCHRGHTTTTPLEPTCPGSRHSHTRSTEPFHHQPPDLRPCPSHARRQHCPSHVDRAAARASSRHVRPLYVFHVAIAEARRLLASG